MSKPKTTNKTTKTQKKYYFAVPNLEDFVVYDTTTKPRDNAIKDYGLTDSDTFYVVEVISGTDVCQGDLVLNDFPVEIL